MKTKHIAAHCRVDRPGTFRMKNCQSDDTFGISDRAEVDVQAEKNVETLSQFQEKLYAQSEWSVLLILQAMDAAGKDSTIKHVLTGVNPQGCQVFSFKAPSAEELAHDFLWRCSRCLPERGKIGIFNRSYYEDVLVVRVHPEYLGRQRIPERLVTPQIWKHRFEDINAFERHLARNGTLILKFFLHVSFEEQRERFLKRLSQDSKNWKFSPDDISERALWNKYMAAYEDMIRNTSTPHAPWYVIPADHKWSMRFAVSRVIIDALGELGLTFPKVPPTQRRRLGEVRRILEAEKK